MKEKLLNMYYQGFDDELAGKVNITPFKDSLLFRAYEYGRIDARYGDDVPSIDAKTDDIILKMILKDKTLFA